MCAALLLFALATRGPASWLLGAAALLSKETALIWPALAALRDRAPGSAGDRRCAWRARIPELLIVAAVLAARHAVLASFAGSFGFDLAESAVGALHLIGLFAGPWLAAQVYVIPLSIPPLLPGAAVGLALVAAAVVAARRRPATRPWLAAAAISLAPGVAALATAHILGPRLLYLPSAFLCLWVAELLVPALTRVRSRSRRLAAVVAGATVLVATTAWGALRWRDDLTFWRHAAAGAPRPDVLAKLALLEHDSGDLAAAWRTLERPGRLPQTHYLRALILSEIGCPDRAVAEYRQALALQPDYPAAAINLRALTSRHGEAPPPCAVDVPTALADPETLNAAALARAREGEGRQAHALIDAALRLRPDWPEALYTRAQLHYLAKDFPAAVTTAESLLQIDPAFTRAYKVLGLSQAKLGQRAAAHDSLTRYLSAHPTAPDAAELRAIIDQLESEP